VSSQKIRNNDIKSEIRWIETQVTNNHGGFRMSGSHHRTDESKDGRQSGRDESQPRINEGQAGGVYRTVGGKPRKDREAVAGHYKSASRTCVPPRRTGLLMLYEMEAEAVIIIFHRLYGVLDFNIISNRP
jgi:hypothetical protein